MRNKLSLMGAGLVVLGAAASPAAAQNRVTVSPGSPVSMTAAGSAENEYDVNSGSDPNAFCRNGTPLTVGWAGATAPISGTNLFLSGANRYFELDPRRPKAAGSLRAIAVCASGKQLRPTLKTAQSGTAVSCGAKLTLGFAASESWPYVESAIKVGPSGANGWVADAGERARPQALCVARSAFKRVKTVRRTGTFATGSVAANLTAACGGAHRLLAWGYEAAPIPGNAWRSVETTSSIRTAPFVAAAVPTAGAKGLKLTLRTADNAAATGSAPIALSLRCGVPSGR